MKKSKGKFKKKVTNKLKWKCNLSKIYGIQQKQRGKSQMNTIRNEREVKTNTTEIQRIIKDHYEQLYVKKLDNIEKMDKFLETYHLPILNHEEIENLNRSFMSKKFKYSKTSKKQKYRSKWLLW